MPFVCDDWATSSPKGSEKSNASLQSTRSNNRTLNCSDSNKYHTSGAVTIEDFEIVKVIGRGSFGKVYLVKKKNDG